MTIFPFSEKKCFCQISWNFYILEYVFLSHLDFDFNLIAFLIFFFLLFKHVLKTCHRIKLNPSWDASQWHKLQHLKIEKISPVWTLDANNIIFRNVEIFTRKTSKNKILWKRNMRSSEIFYLLKWKFKKLTNYSIDMCWSLARYYRHFVCVFFLAFLSFGFAM